MELKDLIAGYAENVTGFRFGRSVKVTYMSHMKGWSVHVDGPVGGHHFNFRKIALYGNKDYESANKADFYTENLGLALAQAEALADNLSDEGRVVNPSTGFISKYLNDAAFKRLESYWVDEADLKVLAR